MIYHSVGPISDFGPAMSGCCGANVENYDPGPAPLGCYYYCMSDPNASQDEYFQIRDCIIGRGYEYKDRTLVNGTRSWFVASGRTPDQASAATLSLRQASKFGVWGFVVLGMAFTGGLAGVI